VCINERARSVPLERVCDVARLQCRVVRAIVVTDEPSALVGIQASRSGPIPEVLVVMTNVRGALWALMCSAPSWMAWRCARCSIE
jgi:hypothetical protein